MGDTKCDVPLRSLLIGSMLNGFVVVLMSFVWYRFAHKLTAWENHRTAREHEQGLILVITLCDFLNDFSSLFFVTFLKSRYWVGKFLPFQTWQAEHCIQGLCIRDSSLILV